jgi:hypothetical protein
MNDDRLQRLRAYLLSANATMGRIPAPVPPRPQQGWDGPTFDTLDMYLAYNRLPADLQELAAASHSMCETALEWQEAAASGALAARYALMVNVVQRTELVHHKGELYGPRPVHEYLTLVPNEDEEDAGEDEGEDADAESAALIAEVQREVEAYVRRSMARRDAAIPEDAAAVATAAVAMASPATPVEPPAPTGRAANQRMVRAWAVSATVVAAVCAGLLIWQHAAAPAPVAATMHQPVDPGRRSGRGASRADHGAGQVHAASGAAHAQASRRCRSQNTIRDSGIHPS